jgi:hypothetical protein
MPRRRVTLNAMFPTLLHPLITAQLRGHKLELDGLLERVPANQRKT